MTTETQPKGINKEKRRMADSISGGIFLISLGVLIFTGWWWPGIMVAIGLTSGASLIFRGKTWQGISSLIFFCGIAIAVELLRTTNISWMVILAFFLIGTGIITMVKTLFFRD